MCAVILVLCKEGLFARNHLHIGYNTFIIFCHFLFFLNVNLSCTNLGWLFQCNEREESIIGILKLDEYA